MGGASGLYAGKGDEAEATDALKVAGAADPLGSASYVSNESWTSVSAEKYEGVDVCAP
jgi:hypothetical protein